MKLPCPIRTLFIYLFFLIYMLAIFVAWIATAPLLISSHYIHFKTTESLYEIIGSLYFLLDLSFFIITVLCSARGWKPTVTDWFQHIYKLIRPEASTGVWPVRGLDLPQHPTSLLPPCTPIHYYQERIPWDPALMRKKAFHSPRSLSIASPPLYSIILLHPQRPQTHTHRRTPFVSGEQSAYMMYRVTSLFR